MLFVCYTPKFPENPEPNRTNRDLGRSCSVSSRSIGCSSRFGLGLGLGREVKNLIGIGLNPRTDTEHRAVSVHSQAWFHLIVGYLSRGLSFRQVEHVFNVTKKHTAVTQLGNVSDTTVANQACIVCAIN